MQKGSFFLTTNNILPFWMIWYKKLIDITLLETTLLCFKRSSRNLALLNPTLISVLLREQLSPSQSGGYSRRWGKERRLQNTLYSFKIWLNRKGQLGIKRNRSKVLICFCGTLFRNQSCSIWTAIFVLPVWGLHCFDMLQCNIMPDSSVISIFLSGASLLHFLWTYSDSDLVQKFWKLLLRTFKNNLPDLGVRWAIFQNCEML